MKLAVYFNETRRKVLSVLKNIDKNKQGKGRKGTAYLLPTLQIFFYLRQLASVEGWLLDAAAFLAAVIIEQAEGIFAKLENGDEVAGCQQSHAEVAEIPHQLKA